MQRPNVRLKRIYDAPEPEDGLRVLVDHLWPRGMSREKAQIDEWFQDLAPSHVLRQWFDHDPKKWKEFQRRYHQELLSPGKRDRLYFLLDTVSRKKTTFLFAAKDQDHNNAVALREFLMTFAAEKSPASPAKPTGKKSRT